MITRIVVHADDDHSKGWATVEMDLHQDSLIITAQGGTWMTKISDGRAIHECLERIFPSQ